MKTSHHTLVTQRIDQINKLNTQIKHIKNCNAIQFIENDQIRHTLQRAFDTLIFPHVAGAILDYLENEKTKIIDSLKHYNVEYDGE